MGAAHRRSLGRSGLSERRSLSSLRTSWAYYDAAGVAVALGKRSDPRDVARVELELQNKGGGGRSGRGGGKYAHLGQHDDFDMR